MNMDKFIRLHNSDDNGMIVVNTDVIIAIVAFRENGRSTSKIYLDTCCSLAPFIVNETPALIIQPDNKEFITMHEITTNDVVVIRKDEISVIDTVSVSASGRNLKSKLYFCGNSELKPIIVHESAEKIMNQLNEEVENK